MKIVAIKERSAGNDTIGEMWLETKIFSIDNTLLDVIEWQRNKGRGKLIITVEDSEVKPF